MMPLLSSVKKISKKVISLLFRLKKHQIEADKKGEGRQVQGE
jgi:hypothetical protein